MDRRIEREKKTVAAMIRMHCHDVHGTRGGLCLECEELTAYALERVDRCPFGDSKPVCSHCERHCYKSSMRERVRAAMRYAGPRMITRHPILAIWHVIDKRRTRTGPGSTS